jgi:hypothetical protein
MNPIPSTCSVSTQSLSYASIPQECFGTEDCNLKNAKYVLYHSTSLEAYSGFKICSHVLQDSSL